MYVAADSSIESTSLMRTFSASPPAKHRAWTLASIAFGGGLGTLENAGQDPDKLIGSQTGVFVGITTNDFAQLLKAYGPDRIDAYHLTGNHAKFTPGRIAYVLGLQGPAMSVDSACSSSLVTVHLACQSLRSGECDLALAGGVNLILSPLETVTACKARCWLPTAVARPLTQVPTALRVVRDAAWCCSNGCQTLLQTVTPFMH